MQALFPMLHLLYVSSVIKTDATPQNEDIGFLFTRVGSASQEGNSGSDNSIMARLMGCTELLKKKNINVIHTISKLLNLPVSSFHD
ncbi:hypothetical protein Fmac_031303 [Flemingia macrophylla]|uniref:Uncharacterized protein n=1 Tax=Flemingia macrophylla TaxID=520843 RepID=A0ABD1L1M6_9FABA